MKDLKAERAMVILDSVVATNVGFRRVKHGNSYTGIVAEDVFGPGSDAVAAIQNQVAGSNADAAAPVVRYSAAGDVTVHIKGAASDADSRPRAVLDCTVGDVDQGVNAS